MNKFLKDTLFEHGEFSIKRFLVYLFSIIAFILCLAFTYKIILASEIREIHLYLFAEIISFIGLLLGLTVANKHKALSKSTNKPEEDQPH